MGFADAITTCFHRPERVFARAYHCGLALALTALAAGLATSPADAATSPRATVQLCRNLSVKPEQLLQRLHAIGWRAVAPADVSARSQAMLAAGTTAFQLVGLSGNGREAHDRQTYAAYLNDIRSKLAQLRATPKASDLFFEGTGAVLEVRNEITQKGAPARDCALEMASSTVADMPQITDVTSSDLLDPNAIVLFVGALREDLPKQHPVSDSSAVNIASVKNLSRHLGAKLGAGEAAYLITVHSLRMAEGAQP